MPYTRYSFAMPSRSKITNLGPGHYEVEFEPGDPPPDDLVDLRAGKHLPRQAVDDWLRAYPGWGRPHGDVVAER